MKPRALSDVLDALPFAGGRATVADAFALIEAAGFLSPSELALALHVSESDAARAIALYYRDRPNQFYAELARQRQRRWEEA